jgi:hypothetical protein
MGNPAEKTTGHPTRVMNTEILSVLASEFFVKSFYIPDWAVVSLALMVLGVAAAWIRKSNEFQLQRIRVLRQTNPRRLKANSYGPSGNGRIHGPPRGLR